MTDAEMSFANANDIQGTFKQAGSDGSENDLGGLPTLVPKQTYDIADEVNAADKADEAKSYGRKWTISELFTVVLVVVKVRASIKAIAEKAWEAKRTDAKKHAPVTGKNEHFSWANNTHVNRKPFVVGETTRKNEVRLRLKADNGKFYLFKPYKEVDWKDSKSISKLNAWRRQIFRRCLNKEGDSNPSRPAWTIKEQKYLNFLIGYKKSSVRKRNGKLGKKDWEAISNAHNSKFQGKTLSREEPLARSKVAKGLSLPGQTLKNPKPLPARTVASMKNMISRWEGVDQNAVSSAVAPSGVGNAAGL